MGCPVGIPQAEGGIVGHTTGIRMHLMVGSIVAAIHVAELTGSYHGMIEGGIESGTGRGIFRTDIDLPQLRIPSLVGLCADSLEIPTAQLCFHIGTSSFHAGRRQGHLQHHRLAGIHLCPGIDRTCLSYLPTCLQAIGHQSQTLDRLCKLGIEEDALIVGPPLRIAIPFKRMIVYLTDITLRGRVPASTILKVDHDGSLLGLIERIAMQPYTLRGSQLSLHTIACQIAFVITRTHLLTTAVAIAPQSALRVFLRTTGIGHLPCHRHHRHIKQVTDTRSTEVGMRVAYHGAVALVVAAAPVPLLRNAGGTQLYQSKGHIGPNKHMTMPTRSYQRVHIVGISL